jgi:uncharacterized membrane protein
VLRWSLGNTDYIDGTLVFGPPLIGFALQYTLVRHLEFGAAYSALALGLFYTALAYRLHGRARVGLLKEICLALGVVFATLAVPLAFDAYGVSMIYAVEGAGIYWLSLVQRRRLAKAFSLVLIVAAAVSYLQDMALGVDTLLIGSSLGAALLGGALLFCHYAALRAPDGALTNADGFFRPIFAVVGLSFLYLIAPFNFLHEGTVIAWALAVPVTVLIGLYLASEIFPVCAVGILSLGALLFLSRMSVGAETLLENSPLAAALLGGAALFCHFLLRRTPDGALTQASRFFRPVFAMTGLFFLYLIAPLCFLHEGTVIAWALAAPVTVLIGLRLESEVFLACAVGVLLLGALLFLSRMSAGAETLLENSPLAAALLGGAALFSYSASRRPFGKSPAKGKQYGSPSLATGGLSFLYLIAPLCFLHEGTVIAWALAGVATVFAGLRLESRAFLVCAFGIELLGGLLFLGNLQMGDTNILASGWTGLVCAALIGLALIVSAILTQSDARARQNEALVRRLSFALLAGLVFVNLALLFVLDWNQIGVGWAMSGLLLICLGLWQRQGIVLYFGLALEAVAGSAFIYGLAAWFVPSDSWAPAALALAAMAGAWRMHHVAARRTDDSPDASGAPDPRRIAAFSGLLLAWGVGWWLWTVINQISFFCARLEGTGFFARELRDGGEYLVLLTLTLSAALWSAIARRTKWRSLSFASCALPLAAATCVLVAHGPGPFALGFPAWTFLFAVHLGSLRRLADVLPAVAQSVAHMAGVWLFIGVLTLASRDVLAHYATGAESAWPWLGWALAPSLYLWLVSGERGRFWPLDAFAREYRFLAALPVATVMLVWFWSANTASAGDSAPLPYLPLVNPLELGLLLVLLTCWRWGRARLPQAGSERQGVLFPSVAGVFLLAFLTMAVCRVAHFWLGVSFSAHAMTASMAVQAGWSLVWTLFALTLMIGGNRWGERCVWMAGAALIAVVVAKLFFVELGNQGGLARIVSFIGVGVLLLVVGYFSPLPPKAETGRKESAARN